MPEIFSPTSIMVKNKWNILNQTKVALCGLS